MTLFATSRAELRGVDRARFFAAIQRAVEAEDLSLGDAVRVLRAAFLGMNRSEFSKLVGVSKRELAKLEGNDANPTIETLNRVFKPFGMRVGLLVRQRTFPDGTLLVTDEEYGEWADVLRETVRRHTRGRTGHGRSGSGPAER